MLLVGVVEVGSVASWCCGGYAIDLIAQVATTSEHYHNQYIFFTMS